MSKPNSTHYWSISTIYIPTIKYTPKGTSLSYIKPISVNINHDPVICAFDLPSIVYLVVNFMPIALLCLDPNKGMKERP